MLKYLQIDNLAVIDHLELNFNTGMTVLTGETGAGKSILIDALGLILGDRADTSVIRAGRDRTEIIAGFELDPDSPAAHLLQEQSVNFEDGEFIIRRVVSRDGRSRAYLNTSSVPVQLLRELGVFLVDIYGQHAHQSLLKPDNQLAILDSFGGYDSAVTAVSENYQRWLDINRELQELNTDEGEFNARLSLLEYQVEELENLDLKEDEVEELDNRYRSLANVSKLQEVVAQSLAELGEDESSISRRLSSISREISELVQHDKRLDSVRELLESARIQLSEATADMQHYLDNLEQDPGLMKKTEERLNQLHDIARKHHIRPARLPAYYDELAGKLQQLRGDRNRVAELEKQQAITLKEYNAAAARLHASREKHATTMSDEITARLKTLGMPECRFRIDVSRQTDLKPHRNGSSQVEFVVAANPGQDLQPVRKAASGGELSRISLAIQVVAREEKSMDTMIFDEVDAGIGGGTAEIVGKSLHGLAKHRQILCVTHLPQVASQGDNHYRVLKETDGQTTSTAVTLLDQKSRVEEIARMLGGVKISKQTRSHAEEMLNSK